MIKEFTQLVKDELLHIREWLFPTPVFSMFKRELCWRRWIVVGRTDDPASGRVFCLRSGDVNPLTGEHDRLHVGTIQLHKEFKRIS